jgi:Xaa-Pro dipeptidase
MYIPIFQTLQKLDLDAYLVYDFRGSNFIGRRVLNFTTFTTRRWIALFTKDGQFHLVIPKLEESLFAGIEATKHVYVTHGQYRQAVADVLAGQKKVALEYSPHNDIPVLDILPAGFVELLRELAPEAELVSSANLTQYLAATWGEVGLASHRSASKHLEEIVRLAWAHVKEALAAGTPLNDYQMRQFIAAEYKKRGLYSEDDTCIVSTNARNGNPHYWPTAEENYPIEPNSLLLIDIWAKHLTDGAVYSDSTFMAWIGPDPVPERVQTLWNLARDARDAGINYVLEHQDKEMHGCEIDSVVRKVIEDGGYGEFFVHRTGHSIDSNDHGNGANIDDFETHDTRQILPDTAFSIEPGIYLKDLGFRTEIDMYVHPDGHAEVTTWKQDELELL